LVKLVVLEVAVRVDNTGCLSRSAASLGLITQPTEWMQPFGACITEISICSFWLALSLLCVVGYATM